MHPQIINEIMDLCHQADNEALFARLMTLAPTLAQKTAPSNLIYDGVAAVCQSLWCLGRHEDAQLLLQKTFVEPLFQKSKMTFWAGPAQFNPGSIVTAAIHAPTIDGWAYLAHITKDDQLERLRTSLINIYFDTPATPLAAEQMTALWDVCDINQRRDMLSYCSNELFDHNNKRSSMRNGNGRKPLLKDLSLCVQLAQQSHWDNASIVASIGSILLGSLDEAGQVGVVDTLCDALPWKEWVLHMVPVNLSSHPSHVSKNFADFIINGHADQSVAQLLSDTHKKGYTHATISEEVLMSKVMNSLRYLMLYPNLHVVSADDKDIGSWKGLAQIMDWARPHEGYADILANYDHVVLQSHVSDASNPTSRPRKL